MLEFFLFICTPRVGVAASVVRCMRLQVVTVALVLSYITRRDSELAVYEDAFGEMQTTGDSGLT